MGWDPAKGWKAASLAMGMLAALLALRLGLGWRESGSSGGTGEAGGVELPEFFRWPERNAGLWRVFRSGEPVAPPPAPGALSGRYRLAGVFLVLAEEDGGAGSRCAILDERATRQQVLALEGEWIGPVQVVKVERDHVVLTDGEREEVLPLAAGSLPGAGRADAPAAAADAPVVLETNRFGNRVGEMRWEFRRQAVLDYYQEMMDNPERLASLFLAMEADRDEEGRVAGYRLNMEAGEKEFYSLVGFQDGDVVRKVNSMRMTSQRRAEFFIGEFVQDRLGAVVIDIERNGEPKKLVYLVK